MTTTVVASPQRELSPLRLTLLRGGYGFMGVGLVVVKWPQLPDAHSLPLYESVTLSLLTAMSVLALIGIWRPLRMLPVLVLEVLWKALWLGLVALPLAVTGDLDASTTEVAVNCAFGVVVLAVVPWDLVVSRRVRRGRQ